MNAAAFGIPAASQGRLLREMVVGDFPLNTSNQLIIGHCFETLPFIQCYAVCYGAQAGWQPGDIILLGSTAHDASASGAGIQIIYSSGQVKLSVPAGSVGNLVNKTAPSTPALMTAGLWRLRVRMIG